MSNKTVNLIYRAATGLVALVYLGGATCCCLLRHIWLWAIRAGHRQSSPELR